MIRHKSLNPGKTFFVIMILMLSLVSCEKEVDLSNLIISSEEPLSYIYWSESSDDILYIIEDPYVSYGLGVSIYTVDITTKENRKIIDIINHAGYIISLTNNKIYYTNCLDPDNKKLYSWDISGQTGELVKDSLVYVTYLSKKYLAYLKNIPNELTPLWTTVLYDLESGSERIIAPGSNNFPLSISPDGSQLLLGVSNKDGLPSLVNTQTGDITDLTLSYYSSACGYHWKEGAVYTMYSDGLECSIKNMRTGNILISLEDLNNGCSCSFNFSPSGQFIYNVNEVRTAQGKLEKSYLNLINTNNLEKTVIDLGDRLVYQVKFSPDETRIAYIGDQNKIYILNL